MTMEPSEKLDSVMRRSDLENQQPVLRYYERDNRPRRKATVRVKRTNPGEKEHRFLITVKTYGSRKSAETALLVAFGVRQPDNCEFRLQRKKPPEEIK